MASLKLKGVVEGGRALRVFFQGSPSGVRYADFHHFWLRHNSDLDRHPQTGERIVDSSEIDIDRVAPKSVNFTDSHIKIEWDKGHISTYTADFLLDNAYAPDLEDVPPPPSNISRVLVDVAKTTTGLKDLIPYALSEVDKNGVVFVVNNPLDTEEIIKRVEAVGLVLRETHFGRIEDLRTDNTTNKNTDQLGYTDASVQLHTDQPFIADPPRYQLLQCVNPAPTGGESFLVDGLAAARYLKRIDEDAFNLLSTMPVRFHRKQKAFESKQLKPILDYNGPNGFQIRYSYFSMAPHIVPFGKMESWYRAYNKFANLVRDENHQFKYKLNAGDFVFYNNHRMLHARTSFQGPRWLKGVYFDPKPVQ